VVEIDDIKFVVEYATVVGPVSFALLLCPESNKIPTTHSE
jgi:hypothetical protein